MARCVIDLGGEEPCHLTVRLIAGMPWTSPSMSRTDASPWPAGLRLVFADETEWPASLDGPGTAATITADAADVSAVVNGSAVTLRDDDTIYGTGRVQVRRMPL